MKKLILQKDIIETISNDSMQSVKGGDPAELTNGKKGSVNCFVVNTTSISVQPISLTNCESCG